MIDHAEEREPAGALVALARQPGVDGRIDEQFVDAHAARFFASGRFAFSTSSGTITVRAQYDTFDRWNGNHCGSSMISTGIIGTARHGIAPYSASWMRVNTFDISAPPIAWMARRARCMLGVLVVADHLQREIRFHARADVRRAVGEQRPAAVGLLDAAQILADLLFGSRFGVSPR